MIRLSPLPFNPDAIAQQGCQTLASMLKPDGQFIYGYDSYPPATPKAGYNAVRHAGAVWAMCSVGGGRFMAPGKRALAWLTRYRYHDFGQVGWGVRSGEKIKLGGNGLAILAHLALRTPQDITAAKRLGDFILAQQRPDGDFHHEMSLEGQVLPFRSEYSTGEALFGLMRLYHETRDSKYLDACIQAEKGLAASGYGIATQSHWMLYFLKEFFMTTYDPAAFQHARQIAREILTHPEYRTRNRSTPTACRSEGLMAYWGILASNDADRYPVLQHVVTDCIQQALYYRNGYFIAGESDSSIRIDFIQHNISAFHALARALESPV